MRNLTMLMLLSLALPAAAATPDAAFAMLKAGEWMEYDVDALNDAGSPCCFNWQHGEVRDRGCSLGSRDWNFGTSTNDAPSISDQLRIFVRSDGNKPDRVRALGGDCPVSTAGQVVHAVDGIAAAASVNWLAQQAPLIGKSEGSGAVAALALHAEPAATAALVHLSAPAQRKSVRRDAIFWLGQARGVEGFRAVNKIIDGEADKNIRRHAVFSLSQSKVDEAQTALRHLSRTHGDADVRGEALFWMAQRHDAETESSARWALGHDSSSEVRRKAIFALSQLPHKRAIPALRAIVEQPGPREQRREALFWLGQIDDDAVLPVFDKLLSGER